ncbi:MAG: SUMF1/EgtB/PvdO family nonheme iron enzyme [Candidatus Aminicenantes bacterium]|nr:SUMF1/EgtB/PvdO family nonheme iron enzyme [Candidatus Aminicenantes bacterium]
MIKGSFLKRISMIFLFFFVIFIIGNNFSYAQGEVKKEEAKKSDVGMKKLEKNEKDGNVIAVPSTKTKKKKFPWLLVVGGAVVVGIILYLILNKKTKKYDLTVNLGEGVQGTPSNGTYTYKKGEVINYNYSAASGYSDLNVLLDGSPVSAGGTITMNSNHTLAAAATELGSIKVSSTPTGASIWLDDSDTGKKTNTVLQNVIPGSHKITLKKSGYWDEEVEVTVEPGKQSQVSKNLVKGVEWIKIPAGEFKMGDNFDEGDTLDQPVHKVYLDQYYISKYEVTFAQYDKFCEKTGRTSPEDEGWGRGSRPVIYVSWHDAKAFCEWLSQKTGKNIHLPTEAQWEKAARGTDQRRYPWGNSTPSCSIANHNYCRGKTMPVGSYPDGVSPYGIHDMAGNVFEWCSDWYSPTYYSNSPYNNPQGPSSGSTRVNRGGHWRSISFDLRSADRCGDNPSGFGNDVSIRVCYEK